MMKHRDIRIDFLKGVAMIFVILLHSFQMIEKFPSILKIPLLFGQVGVQLFFLCSGFLIVKIYFEKSNTINFNLHGKFMLKKYISLAFPFVMFLCIYSLVNIGFNINGMNIPYSNNTHFISICLNILLLHGLFPFCFNNVVPGGWYVGTLFLLFLICPIFLFKKAKTYKVVAILISIVAIIVSFILKSRGISVDNGSYFYFSFLNQLPAFIVGMGMGLEKKKNKLPIFFTIYKSIFEFLLVGILFLFEFTFSYALIPILVAFAFENVYELLKIVSDEDVERFGKMVIYIGKNTYPIYLSHFLTVWYIPVFIKEFFDIHWCLLWAIALIGSVLLCVFSSKLNWIITRITKEIIRKIKL